MPVLPGFNLTGIKPAEGRREVPPDHYVLRVHSSQDKASEAAPRYLSVRSQVMQGAKSGEGFANLSIFQSYFYQSEKEYPRAVFKRFLLAVGLQEEHTGENFDTDWINDRQFIAKVIKTREGYTNITNEQPYTEETWQAICQGEEDSAGGNGVPEAAAPPAGGALVAPPIPRAPATPQLTTAPSRAAAPMVPPRPRIPQPAPPPRSSR